MTGVNTTDFISFYPFVFTFLVLFAVIGYVIYRHFSPNENNSNESISRTNSNTDKDLGTIGEDEIDRILQTLDPNDYIVLRNLILLNNNTTHQIDHVVVSNYGIFVIETKNYSGYVKGSDKYRKWVQFIGKKKYFFLNPIIQNYGHIKALEAFYPEYASYFVPIVCFTDKTNLDVRTKSIVINSNELLLIIDNYRTEVLIPDINEVAQNLKNLSLDRMSGINQDHLKNVRKYK